MAKFDGKHFRGVAGPVIFKTYRGQQLATSKPKFNPQKQTKESKASASLFGKASNLAASFRAELSPLIIKLYDGGMINRLNTETMYCLNQAINKKTQTFHFEENSFQRLNGFEFNNQALLRNNFLVQPQTELSGNILSVKIPEMHLPGDLTYPKGCTTCVVAIEVAMFDLVNGKRSRCPIQFTEIETNHKDKVIEPVQFDFEIERGCLCVIMFALQYTKAAFAGTMLLNTKEFNPTAILKAFIVPGEVDVSKTKKWKEMKFKNTYEE
jgi:hypothetical protein